MSLTAIASTTQEIKLDTRTKQRLLREFRQIQQLRQQKAELEAKIKASVNTIAEIRGATGQMSLEIEGFKTTLVASTQSRFNKKKFAAIGGDLGLYEEAMEIVPKKP